MPRILITGTSSGFGRAIVAQFLDQDWEVIATMRNPSAEGLTVSDNLRLLPLDVTVGDSIAAAIAQAGPLDALVNNAGVGMLNVLEGAEIARARELFETNVLGTMAMTRAVMPGMRNRRRGVIVNISSSVTLRPLPALSIYSASKAAVNASPRASRWRLRNSACTSGSSYPAARPRPPSDAMPWPGWAWTCLKPITTSFRPISRASGPPPRKRRPAMSRRPSGAPSRMRPPQ